MERNRQSSFHYALHGFCGKLHRMVRSWNFTAEHYLHPYVGWLDHVVMTGIEQGLDSQPSTMRTIKIKCAGYVYPDDPSPA
jgi:hypothetical protein